jgi:uncharacterized LabA/DUF88 family protein
MHDLKKKVNVYVDWFNFYYALLNKINDPQSPWRKEYQWCNLYTLFSQFLKADEELNKVYFFSAYRIKDAWSIKRHKTYVEALTKHGVIAMLGKYQNINRSYKRWKNPIKDIVYNGSELERQSCKQLLQLLAYQTYEEKETDVKIALQIIEDAFLNKYDHAYIVSWDSDIIPAVESIKRLAKNWSIDHKLFSCILIPWTKWFKIRSICDFVGDITYENMENSIMPHKIVIDKQRTIEIPSERLVVK